MLIDNSFIAYEYSKNLYVPKEIYPSGEKEETNLIDKYNLSDKNPAVLTLEFDIINKDGLGLKKGFYNVEPDKYLDYLLIYQAGNLKAKIPVFEMNFYETINSEPKQKVKKMSYRKFQKEQEKEKRKYFKGINPLEVDYKTAEIEVLKDVSAIILIYNSNNIELKGLIKF